VSESASVPVRIGLVVVTHGRLAEELVTSLANIVGELASPVEAVSIDWNDGVELARKRIGQAITRMDRGAGVLLVTDMFGGTPSNLALALHEPGRIEIVTGVNLPMLIKFGSLPSDVPLLRAAKSIAAQARESIQVASELLSTGPPGGGDPPP
jgi:PTS system mannose-specific IIA component